MLVLVAGVREVNILRVILLIILTITFSTINSFAEVKSHAFLDDILSMPDYVPGAGIFFSDQDPQKMKIIRQVLGRYGFTAKVMLRPTTGNTLELLSTSNPILTPNIEYIKINPIKYRMIVHAAKDSFPLIFTESFDNHWKAYIVSYGADLQHSTSNNLSTYKLLEGNDNDQATASELKSYLDERLVTYLGDGVPKKKEHYLSLDNGRRKLDHVEQYTIGFISKNFHGTIQNDNLPMGMFYETWFSGRFNMSSDYEKIQWKVTKGLNNKVIELPDMYHWRVNGIANSWWIDLDMLHKLPQASVSNPGYYRVNSDGSIDFEIVIEFWSQRLLYIGLSISAASFLGCIIYLVVDWKKRRKVSATLQKNFTRDFGA
ncbi:MAG: hypothetical protein HQK94_18620 [Nitrospirae bacterium]|nr:hypothetical protein [Nitrospirota bacterium]